MRVFANLDELRAAVGEHLGAGEWHTIGQDQVNLFADATGDHQWIHVDPERAKAGPFGAPIAHGYLTLSLLPALMKEVYRVEGLKMGVNYGSDRVRFPTPVPVGSRVRASVELLDVVDTAQGTRATVRAKIEIEGQDKPACVADSLSLMVP